MSMGATYKLPYIHNKNLRTITENKENKVYLIAVTQKHIRGLRLITEDLLEVHMTRIKEGFIVCIRKRHPHPESHELWRFKEEEKAFGHWSKRLS